jgi:hypothetical protein
MFTSSPKAQSVNDAYLSIIASRQDAYNKVLASGKFAPFVYPWDTFSAGLLFLAILVIPRLPKRHRNMISLGVFTWIVYFCIQTMLKARCLGLANGYGIGLMCAWGMIMSVTLLFCNDVGSDLQRIEWRKVEDDSREHSNGVANGSASGAGSKKPTAEKRNVWGVNGPSVSVNNEKMKNSSTNPYQLVWQCYPSSILHCMEWTADLMTTFRGVGWNWRAPTCPPLDIPIKDPQGKLKPRNTASTACSKTTSIPKPTLRQLQLTGLRDFIIQYLMLDFLKTIMITDPYFMGAAPLSSPSPWPFLASTNPSLTINLLTRFTRLTASITGVLSALTFIFSLSPLFFVTLLPLIIPPQILTYSPLLEPALYPPYWGHLSEISKHDLASLWGKWWHQLFRFGISEPSRALIAYLNIDPKSQLARILQLGIAFGLSGFIHASASLTTFSPSKPLSGPLAFFALQAVGIIVQTQLAVLLKKNVSFADWVGSAMNVAFVVLWMCLTGPFLADDFARCGVWLFEPVPVSLLRGMIWGDWWAWKRIGDWVGWYRGETWYRSGLAIY